jgi:LPXTG-motif cell wall-anchored protein
MTGNRIRVGFAVVLLGIALSTGVAGAAPAGCPFSDCADQENEVRGSGEVNTTTAPEDTDDTAGDDTDGTEAVGVVTDTTPVSSGGVLPVTGADLIGLTVVGAAALVGGTLLVRRTRRLSAG